MKYENMKFAFLFLLVVNAWVPFFAKERKETQKARHKQQDLPNKLSSAAPRLRQDKKGDRSNCQMKYIFAPALNTAYKITGIKARNNKTLQPYRQSFKNDNSKSIKSQPTNKTCFKPCSVSAECMEWPEGKCRQFLERNISHYNTLRDCQQSKIYYKMGKMCAWKASEKFAQKCTRSKLYFNLKDCENDKDYIERKRTRAASTVTQKPMKTFSASSTHNTKNRDFERLNLLETSKKLTQNKNVLAQFETGNQKETNDEDNYIFKFDRPKKAVQFNTKGEQTSKLTRKIKDTQRLSNFARKNERKHEEQIRFLPREICFNESFDGSRRLSLPGGIMPTKRIRLNATILNARRQFAFNLFSKKNHQVLHIAARHGHKTRNLVALNHKTMHNEWVGKEERVYDNKKEWFIDNKNFVISVRPDIVGKSLWQFEIEYRDSNDTESIQLGQRRIVKLAESDSIDDSASVEVYGSVRVFQLCYTPSPNKSRFAV